MVVELLIIDIEMLGHFSRIEHKQYYKLLTSASDISMSYMRTGGYDFHRSGGYLSNVLVMPILLSLSTIYHYIVFSYNRRYLVFLFCLSGLLLTLISFSLTGLLITVASIFLHRIFIIKAYLTTLVFGMLLFLIYMYGFSSDILVIERATTNIVADTESSRRYVEIFTGINPDMNTGNVFRVIVGRFSSGTSPFTSHIDYLNILTLVGGGVFIYIFWRWFCLIRFSFSSRNIILIKYGMIMLVVVLGFIHHHSGFTPYPFFFFTVALLKLDNYFVKRKYHHTVI